MRPAGRSGQCEAGPDWPSEDTDADCQSRSPMPNTSAEPSSSQWGQARPMGAVSHRPHARARQHWTLGKPLGQIPIQQLAQWLFRLWLGYGGADLLFRSKLKVPDGAAEDPVFMHCAPSSRPWQWSVHSALLWNICNEQSCNCRCTYNGLRWAQQGTEDEQLLEE